MTTGGGRRLLSLAGSVALLVGCAACSGLAVSPTSSTSSTTAQDAASSAPDPAPTGTVTTSRPPDATLADLAAITVPAYCGRPATSLSSGEVPQGGGPGQDRPTTGSAGADSTAGASSTTGAIGPGTGPSGDTTATTREGTDAGPTSARPTPVESGVRPAGRGELVAQGPTAPIVVDVTGDGAKEVVAEYRCDDGGTPWPSMIVVARAGGDLLGHVKLGEIARTERAAVTSWHPEPTGLVVDWVAFRDAGLDKRPYENLLRFSGAAVSFSATERGRTLGQTTIVDGPDSTSFVTPTGKVACTLDGATVTCAAMEPTWSGKAECSGPVDAVALVDGRAEYACSDEAPFAAAARVTEPPWQRAGSDPTIHSGAGRMAGLAFGRTLTTGLVTCTVATEGVTCGDRLSGHGFTVSPESVRTF